MARLSRKSKWRKYKCMRGSRRLRVHVPETHMMSRRTLWHLMRKYRDVILKPVGGSRGYGVIRVHSYGHGKYKVHRENHLKKMRGKRSIYRYVRRKIGRRSYIAQRRVDLAKVKGHPFDIRVVVQRRNRSTPWEVTGWVAKVAGKGYIVTNIERSGGYVMQVKSAIRRSSIRHRSSRAVLAKLGNVAISSARRLTSSYPGHRIFGFDMGVDRRGRVWVIEANLSPMLSHFTKMEDQTMYRRILDYKEKAGERIAIKSSPPNKSKDTYEKAFFM